MDVRRFLDLYAVEAQEHARLLQRSVLELETGGLPAVEAAFRAAHTLKGMSAAMGFADIADMAHALEDRLAAIRDGSVAADAALVDALLLEADGLEEAVEAVLSQPAPEPARSSGAAAAAVLAPAERQAGPEATPPAGTVWTARIALRSDTVLPAARALLIVRSLQDEPGLLGSDPPEFDDGFTGSFRIFFGAGARPDVITAAIRSAGDVESVTLIEAGATAGSLPASSRIRVDTARLDEIADAVAELSVLFARAGAGAAAGTGAETADRLRVVLAELQHGVLQLRMAPVRLAFERLPRAVRDAARRLGRDVDLVITGDDVQLDRAIIDEIGEPLLHLLRNAVDHGIEAPGDRRAAGKPARGRIALHAERDRNGVCITVSDDGRGVPAAQVVARARAAGIPVDPETLPGDEELFRLLSHPGLSTAAAVSAVSGRGVGLDVVVSRVRALGGAIGMHTVAGAGTTFTIRLPLTLALAQALHVRVGGEDYVIPITHIAEVVELDGDEQGDAVYVRGEPLRLVRLRGVLGTPAGAGAEQAAIIAGIGERRAALAVDELIGREQILVKGFDGVAGMLPCFTGATLLGDGRPALVLDPLSVI